MVMKISTTTRMSAWLAGPNSETHVSWWYQLEQLLQCKEKYKLFVKVFGIKLARVS